MSGEVTPGRSFVPPIKCFQGNGREELSVISSPARLCLWPWAKKLSGAAGFLRHPFDLLVNTAQGGLFLGCSWVCWARKYKGSKDLNFLLVCYKTEQSLCNKALACLSFLDLENQHWKKKSLASQFFPVSVSFSLFNFLRYQLSHTKMPVFYFTWRLFLASSQAILARVPHLIPPRILPMIIRQMSLLLLLRALLWAERLSGRMLWPLT